MRLHMHPGAFHSAYAGLGQASAAYSQAQLIRSNAVAFGGTCNLAHFIVPMLACIRQTQLIHSNVMAWCRMRLRMQPGTFHSAYAGFHQASAAHSQQCRGMLSHVVAHATWQISYLCWPASGKRSLFTASLWHIVACGCICNLAHFIVLMLSCIRQAQFIHINAVACCRMRLHMQPGTFQSAH